jgi:hypothetical protein
MLFFLAKFAKMYIILLVGAMLALIVSQTLCKTSNDPLEIVHHPKHYKVIPIWKW